MADKFTDMLVFARIGATNSFSRAGEELGLSPSAVSKIVSHLEERLGTRLLHRTTRRLNLTEAGAEFYENCKRILADIEDAESSLDSHHAELQGTLRLSVPVAFGRHHLASIFPEFLDQHPKLRIDLVMADRYVDLIDESIDLAIRIADLDQSSSSLVAQKLARSRRLICASPSYLERYGIPQNPADLVHHNCLLFTYPGSGNSWSFDSSDGPESVQVSGNFQSTNTEVLRQMALSGLGLVLKSTWHVGDDLRSGALRAVLSDYQIPEMSIYAIYPHRRYLPPKVSSFIHFLRDRIGWPEPYWDKEI